MLKRTESILIFKNQIRRLIKVEVVLGEMSEYGALRKSSSAFVDLKELLAHVFLYRVILIQGNRIFRCFLKQSSSWVQKCIIDLEDDFVTLADKFSHIFVEAQRNEKDLIKITHRIRQNRVSVVFSLEDLDTKTDACFQCFSWSTF
ncbi:hypothetical protein BJB63x_001830 [Bartonella sp. JB63]|nr:hypothetical protein BJB15x_001840 [Bartonella sp. JB15]AQX28880.1 hypothetical protein BJB63x_001830 [Bartonella sp. JB63]